MNMQRAVVWAGFLGISAALAWAPGHWFETQDQAPPVATQAPARPLLAQADQAVAGAPRDSAAAASGNLFPAQQWTPPPAAAPVIEAPEVSEPVPTAPTAPELPFQFVGSLNDRNDLQVFLQNGEKLYVVRQGDVIDDLYRLDRVTPTELSLVYLPLHQSQTLFVGSAP